MTQGFVDLSMYVAPERINQASAAWLQRILLLLDARGEAVGTQPLLQVWRSPQLLLSQTCGYPLMTALRGQVRVVGQPRYRLPYVREGQHCSLLLVREDDPRQDLAAFFDSHGLVNGPDSNSGMNLLRHALAPLQREGRFFSQVSHTGGHRNSMRALREGQGDLAAIDSVTYGYLARDHSEEVEGLRILGQTAWGPSLPYISAGWRSAEEAEWIRRAMNQALAELPAVAETLAIDQVLPVETTDYQVLLDYEHEARRLGLVTLG